VVAGEGLSSHLLGVHEKIERAPQRPNVREHHACFTREIAMLWISHRVCVCVRAWVWS
jgi:hypothetical protein